MTVNRFGVRQDTLEKLEARMLALGILEEHLEEQFIRGSGPGGQKVNKTSSTVRIKHIPSGIEVKATKSRSQGLNRFYARRMICEKLEEAQQGTKSAAAMQKAKIRKQKKRASRKSQKKYGVGDA